MRLTDRLKQGGRTICSLFSWGTSCEAWTGYEGLRNPAGGVPGERILPHRLDAGRRATLEIDGLNLDAVWDNFIIQVDGILVPIDEQEKRKEKAQQARNEKQQNKVSSWCGRLEHYKNNLMCYRETFVIE